MEDYLKIVKNCQDEFERDCQEALIYETGDKTAKLSHYLTEEGITYIWYSTASHPKTDLVVVVDYLW